MPDKAGKVLTSLAPAPNVRSKNGSSTGDPKEQTRQAPGIGRDDEMKEKSARDSALAYRKRKEEEGFFSPTHSTEHTTLISLISPEHRLVYNLHILLLLICSPGHRRGPTPKRCRQTDRQTDRRMLPSRHERLFSSGPAGTSGLLLVRPKHRDSTRLYGVPGSLTTLRRKLRIAFCHGSTQATPLNGRGRHDWTASDRLFPRTRPGAPFSK